MNCEICCEPYDENEQKPHFLPCGHTLCHICINKSIKEGELICPYCMKNHSVSTVEDVPVAYSLMEAMKIIAKLSIKTDAAPDISLAKILSEVVLAKEPQLHAGVCNEHGSYCLFWCSDCRVWICRDCTVLQHPINNCKILPIKDGLKNIKDVESKSMKAAERDVEDHMQALKDRMKKLSSTIEKYNLQSKTLNQILEEQNEAKGKLEEELKIREKFLSEGQEFTDNIVVGCENLVASDQVKILDSRQQECEQLRKEVKNWISTSQAEMKKDKEQDFSKKLLQKVGTIVRVNDLDSDVKFSMVSKLLGFFERIETDLSPRDLMTLLGLVDAGLALSNEKVSPIKVHNGQVHIHASCFTNVPKDIIKIPVSSIDFEYHTVQPEVFMELSWGGVIQGRVYVKLDELLHSSSTDVQQFYERFQPEKCRYTFSLKGLIGTSMIDVLGRNSYDPTRLCGGARSRHYKLNEPRAYTENSLPKGTVTLAEVDSLKCFSILINESKSNMQNFKRMGNVTRGMSVVEKAACLKDVTQVKITDCGVLYLDSP